MTDLPAYSVRESPRARRVRLTVNARDGLVVVVPKRFPAARIPAIVRERRGWIERALERVRERREALLAESGVRPSSVDLPGIGESWVVECRPTSAEGIRASARDGVLRLSGDAEDVAGIARALRRFGRARASEALPRLIRALSDEEGLPFAAVRVRAQRTRWGSCSAGGHISLNWTLAFLPPDLVRHVMLHELVHTLRLDHSPHFHVLLAEREPKTARLAAELRDAWRHVPWWALDG